VSIASDLRPGRFNKYGTGRGPRQSAPALNLSSLCPSWMTIGHWCRLSHGL